MRIKSLFYVLFYLFFSLNYSFCQGDPPGLPYELYVENHTNTIIYFQLFPVSMLFNGDNKYNLVSKGRLNYQENYRNTSYLNGTSYNYVAGPPVQTELNGTCYNKYYLSPSESDGFNGDYEPGGSANGSCGQIGYGVYKLIIINASTNRIDSCLIDYDYYFYNNTLSTPGDLFIFIENDNPPPNTYRFYYKFESQVHPNNHNVEINYTSLRNYTIRSWEPNGTDPLNSRTKVYGPAEQGGYFTLNYEQDPYNSYNIFPQDPKKDCNLNLPNFQITVAQNQEFPDNYEYGAHDERHGILTLNLSIGKDITTPIQFNYCNWFSNPVPPPIIISEGATLRLSSNKTLTMNTYTGGNYGTNMIVQTGGKLDMQNNSHIIIYNKNAFTFECFSYLNCGSNSTFEIYQGGKYCSGTVYKTGILHLNYHYSPNRYLLPAIPCEYDNLIIFDDSTNLHLLDGATLEIPDNTNLILENPGTFLQLDSNSSIVFGDNSNLVVRDGARITARYCKFKSMSESDLWGGIYIEDCSNDTIQNCDIENAYSGLNIVDNINGISEEISAFQVTNCNFKNTSSTRLLNGIYANNSNYFLIKDNTFTSTAISEGFENAIILNECPSGALNIIGNQINNSTIGINIIQSSPLILRNTINGLTNTGYGIFLDNSNGSIKFNIINNFASSIKLYYSNPYLLKNTLTNAYSSGLELYSYSAPIMKPIVNGGSEYWYSGNNAIYGNPVSGAITFQDESYPVLDSGYNLDAITTGLYLKGDIPSFLNAVLYATYNYWGNGTPESNRFDVSNGDLYSEPYYNGSALPAPESFATTDIGFNLLDTVYIKDLGDSPGRDLFAQANEYEIQSQYASAILKYKNIILNYKNSVYALASLSRIFNCLDKAKSSNNGFILHQNYLSQIKNNNSYPFIIRELCEDFIIKTKVRLGLIQEAISDYTSIYNQNQNNSKGFHALLNKECLLTQIRDTLDNNYSKFNNMIDRKLSILNIINKSSNNNITKSNSVPEKYSLSQNYPNPFNPVTNIKYQIPADGYVSLKIYDITGREIANLVNEYKKAGYYTVSFNGINFASGVYFYRIQAGDFSQVKKMVLIK